MSSATDRDRREAFRPLGAITIVAFVLSVPVANWMVLNVGSTCFPDGPCLIPVWPGVLAPSGVALAGLSLVLRDLVQEEVGVRWAFAAVLVGAIIAALVASPQLAVASAGAFLVAELADLLIYTAMRRRGLFVASLASSMVGLLLDSLIFVLVAFGSMDLLLGQSLGKAWMVLAATPILFLIRRRSRVVAARLA
ncbi:MAG: VUT family protein [Alphaproteobacteria bacterium]|nr:VUT family protein [Alphaproteobacteria bacterium]MBU1559648.1 VUT family protein [Alphaproteobacteria bacterium]MBU2304353.1 VUT family protein [Alphaproteobacteria bacterium]MBU2367138.1 VUT family protein [Alphaproteobacteria bacterium]